LTQLRAVKDQLSKFTKADALVWVDLEDPLEDGIEAVRDWQDGLQEVPVPHEGPESGVIHCRSLPRITTTGQVDQNDTKRPDIVGLGSVASEWFWIRLLTLWRHVKCRAASKVGGDPVLGGKAKVRKLNSPSIVFDQNILRFEVSMEDSLPVAMLNCVQYLKKNGPGLVVVVDIITLLGDFRE